MENITQAIPHLEDILNKWGERAPFIKDKALKSHIHAILEPSLERGGEKTKSVLRNAFSQMMKEHCDQVCEGNVVEAVEGSFYESAQQSMQTLNGVLQNVKTAQKFNKPIDIEGVNELFERILPSLYAATRLLPLQIKNYRVLCGRRNETINAALQHLSDLNTLIESKIPILQGLSGFDEEKTNKLCQSSAAFPNSCFITQELPEDLWAPPQT